MKHNYFSLLLSALLLVAMPACSRTTSKTETRVHYGEAGTTETRTTTTETDSDVDDGCGGLLSCTVDVVGAIIAFPFKVAGALITAIF